MVLDASAVIELLLNSAAGKQIADQISEPSVTIHAPHLVSIEVSQVLRRLARTEILTADRARAAMSALADLDLYHYEHEPLLPRIWDLRANLTAYDAAYVALAEVLAIPLVTLDERLANAPGHHAEISLISSNHRA